MFPARFRTFLQRLPLRNEAVGFVVEAVCKSLTEWGLCTGEIYLSHRIRFGSMQDVLWY